MAVVPLKTTPPIVGLGMVTIDVLAQVPHLPGPDEVFEIPLVEVHGGGPVASAMATAARLGTPSAVVGSVGDDVWGDWIVAGLKGVAVDTSYLYRRAGEASPRAVVLVEGGTGRRSIMYSTGDALRLAVDELPWDWLREARVIHLDGVHPAAALAAARAAREAGVTVSYDGGAGPFWPGLDDLLPLVDLLVVAKDFAARYTGRDDVADAARELARCGASHVVITDGTRGAWSWVDGGAWHQPAFAVDVVDTTGAGDAFHGGYLHAYLAGENAGHCLRFASAVGALACTRLGGRAGLPKRDEVEDFLDRHP
ncbi:MAG: carbohydrate kinase family protein [Trueperaceae bacterium]|nr:carbohydrate kinase family protein [Trueperaceae bacterium]